MALLRKMYFLRILLGYMDGLYFGVIIDFNNCASLMNRLIINNECKKLKLKKEINAYVYIIPNKLEYKILMK